MKTCKNCSTLFEVQERDKHFYEKIAFKLGKKLFPFQNPHSARCVGNSEDLLFEMNETSIVANVTEAEKKLFPCIRRKAPTKCMRKMCGGRIIGMP